MASFLKEQVCDFLTTGGKNNIKPVIYDCVRTRTHAHHSRRREERELVRLRRFSFLRDLIVFWSWLIPLALECGYDSSRTPEQVEYAGAARTRG